MQEIINNTKKGNREILKERALKNSLIEKEMPLVKHPLSVVEFGINNQRFAVEERFASEVHMLKEITPIPGAPPYVSGVVSYRGRIVSLINFRILLNIRERGLTEQNKVLIISANNSYFGIVTDYISEIKELDKTQLSQLPPTISQETSKYSLGVFPDGLVLLDGDKLITETIVTH